MKQMTIFLVCTILLLGSCAPKKDETKDLANKNSKELISLVEKVEALEKEKEKLEKEKTESSESDTDSNSDFDKQISDLRQTIDELRSDLLRYIKQETTKLEQRISSLENNYNDFKEHLDKKEDNYVTIEAFTALRKEIKRELLNERRILTTSISENTSDEDLDYINNRLKALEEKQAAFQTEYQQYYDKAVSAWTAKLKTYIDNQDINSEERLKKFISIEYARLKVEIESSKREITAIKKKLAENFTSLSEENRDYLQTSLKELNQQMEKSKDVLAEIQLETKKANIPEVFKAIAEKQYAPCFNGLKDDHYCFTLGALIYRLGGIFLDSSKFENTSTDFTRYLTLSGINIQSVAGSSSVDKFLVPDKVNKPSNKKANNMTYYEHFKQCHPDKELLLAPNHLWTRSVLLGLVLQKIQIDIEKRRELGILPNKNIHPIKGISGWYRSLCYQNRIYGIDINNVAKGTKLKNSDHIYGAAFDLSFQGQPDHATHSFYVDYVKNDILKNDIFEVAKPLKNSDLIFTIGVGHGKKSGLHMGIGSEIFRTNHVWRY